MANTLINPAWVLMKTSVRLNNNLRFGGNIDRSYSDEFKQAGAKIGSGVSKNTDILVAGDKVYTRVGPERVRARAVR